MVTPNQPHKLEVHAEDNVQPLLTAAVTPDGILDIGFATGASVRPRQMVVFAVSAPTLDGIVRTGVGGVRVAGHLEAKRFELSSAGGGDIILDQVTADELILRASGEGSLTASGTVGRLSLLLQQGGANRFAADLSGLTAGRAKAEVTAGEARLRVSESLTASAWNGGRVRYAGPPGLRVTADAPELVTRE